MKEDLSYHRKSYEKKSMKFEDLKENPIEQFRDWFLAAEACEGVDEAKYGLQLCGSLFMLLSWAICGIILAMAVRFR